MSVCSAVNSDTVGDLNFPDQKDLGNWGYFLAGHTHISGFSVDKAKTHTNSPSSDTQIIIDSYFPHKRSGYIALQRNNFQFIGPDREAIVIDSIDTQL